MVRRRWRKQSASAASPALISSATLTIVIYFVKITRRRATPPPPPAGAQSRVASRAWRFRLYHSYTIRSTIVYSVTTNTLQLPADEAFSSISIFCFALVSCIKVLLRFWINFAYRRL